MSEKRFTNVGGVEEFVHLVFDNETARTLSVKQTVKKLNDQESTITSLKEMNKQLRRRLEKINGGYGHLTHRKGLTANEWVIEIQEEELKKKDEMISEFIERHSEDIVKISEQQAITNKLNDENAKLLSERIKDCEEFEECANKAQSLKKENGRLKDYIDTIFEDNTHICNELDIEDVQFYCERNKDYRSPSCLYQKCFNEENLVGLSEKIKGLFDDE